jgi:hypothetical protein
MAKIPRLIYAALCGLAANCIGQVPDSPPAPQVPAVPSAAAPAAPAPVLGNELPVLDPTTEILQFNGHNFNITNIRAFQARFEKYLNAPEATSKDDREYQAIIERILSLLAAGNATPQNVDKAFKILPFAARYDTDARLCDTLASSVYNVWQAQRNQSRLSAANATLEDLRKTHEWNLRVITEGKKLDSPAKSGKDATPPATTPAAAAPLLNDQSTTPDSTRLAETLAAIKGNQVKRELSEVQAKIEFQGMLVQFFLQRRFQHVLMATRFYQALFNDGDSKLNLGKDSTDLFKKSTGMPPTVSVIDSMANEAVRDIREGVKAFDFLLGKNELQSATMRLQEAFLIG